MITDFVYRDLVKRDLSDVKGSSEKGPGVKYLIKRGRTFLMYRDPMIRDLLYKNIERSDLLKKRIK